MNACRETRDILHRDTTALSDAERLLLEEHLQRCNACRDAREQLQRLRRLANQLPRESIGTQAQQRAISRALLSGAQPIEHKRRRVYLPGLVVVGIAVVLALWIDRPQHPGPVARDVQPVAVDVALVSGDVTGVVIGSELPTNVELRATTDAVVRSSSAQIVIARDSMLSWSPGSLRLLGGMVDIDVDPSAKTSLRVVTSRFIVDVTGTRFRVTSDAVVVNHGSVRILAADGAVLVPVLAAGERWMFAPSPSIRDADASSSRPAPAVEPVPASTWLTRARRAFATADCVTAEQYAEAVFDAGPSRALTAEAQTLLAECALLRGRLDDAALKYQAIVSRFADLPAGETALVALARLEIRRGRAADARRRFEDYLRRYPSGRFVDDAHDYLRTP